MASNYLDQLEDEAIYVIREAASEFARPALLYSAGKDSSVLLWLARKAFCPARISFPLLHIDTGLKFPEMYAFRDHVVAEYGVELLVYSKQGQGKDRIHPDVFGTAACCETLKTRGLIEGLRHFGIDAALGGARREEEKSRAKERFFSVRNHQGVWDPRKQRLEIGKTFNSRLSKGDSMRVFPLSNWTELDIWRYIEREEIEVSPLYFSALRQGVERNGMFFETPASTDPNLSAGVVQKEVRYRTLGCMPCTGGICSTAATIKEVIQELEAVKISERSTRLIDHDGEGSREKKKRRGYF